MIVRVRERERERHGRPWHTNIFLPFQNLTPICKPPSNESRRDRQASIHFQISMMQMQNGVKIIPSQQLTKMPKSVEKEEIIRSTASPTTISAIRKMHTRCFPRDGRSDSKQNTSFFGYSRTKTPWLCGRQLSLMIRTSYSISGMAGSANDSFPEKTPYKLPPMARKK